MEKLAFYLYVSGRYKSSEVAINSVKTFLSEEVGEDYDLFILDVLEDPYLAEASRILVTPTLIKEDLDKTIRIVGNFTDKRKLTQILELEKVYG